MDKQDFQQLFEKNLELSAVDAEKKLGRKISYNFRFVLYGANCSGEVMEIKDCIDKLYLGEDRFYRIIDLSVIEVGTTYSKVFVRVSGHTPSRFVETWNIPSGNGPFRRLIAEEILTAK